MKKTFKFFAVAIAAIMTIGSVTLVSCDKEDSVVNHETKPITKVAPGMTGNSLIPILTIELGKKKGTIFHKYCVRGRGVCCLWFGGMFLAEDFDFDKSYPGNLATNPYGGSFATDKTAGIHAASVVNDSLDLLYDFSCVDESDMEIWLEDIKDGISTINDTVTLDDVNLLDAWGFESPVAIPSGSYPIRSYNIATSQFFIRVPIFEIK